MTPRKNPATAFNGTYAANPAEPTVTFEEMRKLVLEMTREPFLKEIRCDRWAWAKIRYHLDEEYWANQKHFALSSPEPTAVNVYASGTPVVIDDTFKLGQWQAIDTKGNVMQEGNLLAEEK